MGICFTAPTLALLAALGRATNSPAKAQTVEPSQSRNAAEWNNASSKYDGTRNELLKHVDQVAHQRPFLPDGMSLSHYEVPDWYKDIIHQMIDVVSKNGNLLLNAGPRADGTPSPRLTSASPPRELTSTRLSSRPRTPIR